MKGDERDNLCPRDDYCSYSCSPLLDPRQKRTLVKGKVATKKKSANKFVIDCSTAETDSILDVPDFVSICTSF